MRTRTPLTVAAVATVTALLAGCAAGPQPLFTATGAGGPTSSASAEDSKLGWWQPFTYRPGDGLSDQEGTGQIHRLTLTGDPLTETAALADAFGIPGTATESQYSDPQWPSYVAGPQDGSAPSVTLMWTGEGMWWYSDMAAMSEPVVCEAVPGTSTSPAPDEPALCESPDLGPSNALGEAEAARLAADLFADTGLTVPPTDIDVTVDDWQTVATATLTVDGMPTPLTYSAAWDRSGDLIWATGALARPAVEGSYPTVSPSAAVARIADGRWYGIPAPDFAGSYGYGIAASSRSADLPAEDATAPAGESSSSPGSDPTDPGAPGVEPEPVPVSEPGPPVPPVDEPIVEPEPVEIVLDSSVETLLLVHDTDGGAWLVPGYAYPHPDGWWLTVIAVADGIIALPDPITVMPLPAEEK